ncbi:MAG: PEP-CTERM sorting domain-containing protein, partial [Fimbriimonadales bacterium]
MRTSKFFAALATATIIASSALAQTIVRVSAYDINGTGVGHESPGTYDPALSVLDPSTDRIYTFFVSVHPDPNWLIGGPNNSRRWMTLGFGFTYDPNYIDIIYKDPNTGNDVRVSSLPDQAIFSPFIASHAPASGVAAGQKFDAPGGKVRVQYALAATSNVNGNASQNGYLRNFYENVFDGELIRVWVNGPAIASLGGIYNTEPGDPRGNIIIQVNPRDDTRDVQVFGSFIVPEPASMIALGSGLVGLL